MKIRTLKKPRKFICKDEPDLNIYGCCNQESTTSKIEMLILGETLFDFYVTCDVCKKTTNHRWFSKSNCNQISKE